MSLQTVYNRFVGALGRTLPEPIRLTWDDGSYMVWSVPSRHSGPVTIRLSNQEELRKQLHHQGVDEDVMAHVLDILPAKGSVTLYPKSYITLLPSPEHYSLVGDWVILYSVASPAQ